MSWVIFIWVFIGIFNTWYAFDDAKEKLNDMAYIFNYQFVVSMFVILNVLISPYVLLTQVIPSIWLDLKQAIVIFFIKRKVNKILKKAGLKDRV